MAKIKQPVEKTENETLKHENETLKHENELLKKKLKKLNTRLDSIMKVNDRTFRNIFDKNITLEKDSYRFNRILHQSDRQGKTILVQKEHQEELLVTQAKLASMGEMIDAIAHQWKTPLSVINLHIQYLLLENSTNSLTQEAIDKTCNDVLKQITHADSTINEFRSFFRPNTTVESVSLKQLIESSLILLKDELLQHNIEYEIKCAEDFHIAVNQNEFKHVMINLIQNSKDAFIEKEIGQRKITFTILKDQEKKSLHICDNAGGIPKNIIDDIFKAHVTTKEKRNGTGIGLYLTKQIIEKYFFNISVINKNAGVCFTIDFTPQSA